MFLTFEDYIKNTTKQDRMQHIDLKTNCDTACKKHKNRFYKTRRRSQDIARENIVEFLVMQGILDNSLLNQKFTSSSNGQYTGNIQCNHACECSHSSNSPNINAVCHNPLHLYLGTQKENFHDINPNTNKSPKDFFIKSKRSTTLKRKWMHNNIKQTLVHENEIEKFLNDGYFLGRLSHLHQINDVD